MIKGKRITITESYRRENFSEAYINFSSLIQKLEFILLKPKGNEIEFINGFSMKDYNALLKSEFENVIMQIEDNIESISSKTQKISLLIKYSSDFGVDYPYVIRKAKLLFHKNVSFKNLPAKRSKKDIQANKQIQECCQNINFFTKKLNVFFTDLKNAIHTDTTSTTSQDLNWMQAPPVLKIHLRFLNAFSNPME